MNTICLNCVHFWGVDTCEAFNNKIPDSILIDGTNEHTKPLKDQDNDIVFEAKE